MTTATTMTNGVHGFHPEMGEKRPEGQIEASLSHYGKHYFLRTRLTLAGRGVKFRGTIKEGQVCGPRAATLIGMNEYQVTTAAFEAIGKKHSVTMEMLL
jgi:hypothetical protein